MRKETLKKVEMIVQDVADEHGFELVEVEYVKEAGLYYLRVIMDNDIGKFGLDQCEMVARELNPVLDEKDLIEENYFLEVSSPGLSRTLKKKKEFTKYKNRDVDVKLYNKLEELGEKQFEAVLDGLNEDNVVLLHDEKREYKIDRKDIAKISLAVKF